VEGDPIPNPGDTIYSQEWYCDSQGNLNLNGGFGCTYLVDQTTGLHRGNRYLSGAGGHVRFDQQPTWAKL
jgi:hypothetical protein